MGRIHRLVAAAVRDGRLPRPAACLVCGTTEGRLAYHHPDDNEPLRVQALCPRDHRRLHANAIPDPETGLFRLDDQRVTEAAMRALVPVRRHLAPRSRGDLQRFGLNHGLLRRDWRGRVVPLREVA